MSVVIAFGRTVGSVHLLTAVFIGATALSGMAQSGPSGFRCPTTSRLVSVGYTTVEVRSRCREPDEVRTTVELRTVREAVRRWVQGVAHEVTVERTVEVAVDDWTYDFGKNRFMHFLRFENGRLISVREGGYGSGEPE